MNSENTNENKNDENVTERVLQRTETRLYIEAVFISQHRENDLIRVITTLLSYMSDEYIVGRYEINYGSIADDDGSLQLHIPSDIIIEVEP